MILKHLKTPLLLDISICVVLLTVGFAGFLLPVVRKRHATRSEIETALGSVTIEPTQLPDLASAPGNLQALHADISKLREMLRGDGTLDDITRDLRRAIEEQGLVSVKDEKWFQGDPRAGNPIWIKEFTLVGNYQAIAAFLEVTERHACLLEVERLELDRIARGRNEVKASIRLCVVLGTEPGLDGKS